MPIVSDRPSSGVRFVLSRGPENPGGGWVYEGFARTPDDRFPIRATVHPDGTVNVEVERGETDPPAGMGEKVRLLVRTAVRQAAADGDPPPLRITRWRGEK